MSRTSSAAGGWLRGRVVTGTTAATLAVALASTVGVPSASARAAVDPGTLPRGEDPAVAHLVRDTVRDGDLRIPATRRGRHLALWEVVGGYLLDDLFPRRGQQRLVFVSSAGRKQLVAPRHRALGRAVSPDGGLVAWGRALGADPGPPSVVTVARPRTGVVLATRRFHWATVLGVSEHRVLLDRMDRRGRSSTWWWSFRRDRLRLVTDRPGVRADLAHRRLVVGVGDPDSFCRAVVPLARRDRILWRSCQVSPRAWSPDGRRTVATYNYFDDTGVPRWDVRTDRSGALRDRITGRLAWHAVWEDDRHFLTLAQGDDGRAAIVRCAVGGGCERASRLWQRPVPDYLPNFIPPPVVLPTR